jgi:predicted small lipoprotein YifL
MKKKILLSFVVLIMLFAITGCGNKNEEKNKKDDTNIVNDNTNTTNNDSKTTGDSLPISEIKKQYNNDLPLGLENNYVKANGREIVIRLQTSGSSQQQANGPYYIYYNVYVGNDNLGFNCVRDAIYHLEGFGITMLKEFNEEEDAGVNYEFFEWDFTSSAHKGKDKDYVAISLPAGSEDKPQASLMITTDNGKLLGEFIADVVHDTNLTGPDVEKYRNHSGDIVFNSIKDGNITYLTPTEAMYKTDSNGKKVLDSSLAEIELEEHSVTIDNNKVTDTKTSNIYKITNASGKTFNFGEFRHL